MKESTPRPIAHRLQLGKAPGWLASLPAALARRPGVSPGAAPPEIEVAVARAPIEADRVRAYRRFCGFAHDPAPTVPLPMLFSVAYPTLIALFVHPQFPIRALGMVHTGFSIEVERPLAAGETVSLEARLVGWRQEKAGYEVESRIELRDHRGEPIGLAGITTMARGGGHGRAKPGAPRTGPPDEPSSPLVLTADVGRRFAEISGDWNPIHLWPWSARLFGLRRPIAHGMYLVARSVSLVAARFGAPRTDTARRLSVRFKTPAYLPGGAHGFVSEPATGDDIPFELWAADRSRPHLVGSLGP